MSKSISASRNTEMIVLLTELRARLLRVFIFFLILVAGLSTIANQLYTFLAQPLLKFLPQGHLIATQLVTPFFVPFKLALLVAVLFTAPFFLYQAWAFVAPALYQSERKLIWPFLFLGTMLFYLGIIFAYYVIFPMLFHFLAGVAPPGVLLSPDIGEYLDFTIKLLLVFGGLFEIPIVMLCLMWLNIVPLAHFVRRRSYAIVGAFILGMLLAPPDVFSQTVLAMPIWLLYELGILMGRLSHLGKNVAIPESESALE